MLSPLACVIFLGVTLAAGFPAHAWEIEPAVSLPSPVGSTPRTISLMSVAIDISESQVVETYRIRNSASANKQNNFSIYIPPFTWGGVGSDYPDRHFPEFTVEFANRTVDVKRNAIALFDAKDITNDILRARLDPLRVGQGESALLEPNENSNGRLKKLLELGVLETAAGLFLPRWHVQVSYSWKLVYEPAKEAPLKLSFAARPEFFPASRDDRKLAAYIYSHCGTEKDIEQIRRGDLFKDAGELLVKTYIVNFNLGDINPGKATLSYSPNVNDSRNLRSIAYVCTGDEQAPLAKGEPVLGNIRVNSPEGRISLLVISER